MADANLKTDNVFHSILHSREGFLPNYINRLETLRGHKHRDTTRTQDAECLDRKYQVPVNRTAIRSKIIDYQFT